MIALIRQALDAVHGEQDWHRSKSIVSLMDLAIGFSGFSGLRRMIASVL
jgi:hypothetical protein